MKGTEHFGDLGIDRRIMIKEALNLTVCANLEWIDLARVRLQALVNII
jgi:hypothetical protein